MKIKIALKTQLKLFFAILTVSILFNSCKKEYSSEDIKTQNQQKIRNWYSANVNSDKQNPFSTLSPIWDQVQVSEVDGQIVYEISMNNPQKIFIGDENTDKNKANEHFARNDTRLLIFENNKTGLIENGCYMSVVNTGTESNVKSVHYKQPGDLTGNIYYFNPDGTMANGWSYRDGNALQRISVSNEIEYKAMMHIRSEEARANLRKDGKLSYTQPAYCVAEYTLIYGTSCAGVDGYMNCTQYVVGREYTNNCEYGGDSGGGYTPPNPTGGGGTGSGSSAVIIVVEGDKVDPKEETKCFKVTAGSTAVLTIYVQQPNENTRDKMGTNSVGHTFVGIKQDGVTRFFGFYPDSQYASLLGSQKSEIHDNSNTLYHVSISTTVNASQLGAAINYINNYPSQYDLNKYNCTDFAIGVAQKGGLNLPQTTGSYDAGVIKFEGRNPGDLGQDLRNAQLPQGVTRNTTKGNAPKKSGGC